MSLMSVDQGSAASVPPLNVAVILFPGFELLDVAAPAELLGADRAHFRLFYCAEHAEKPVPASCMHSKNGTVGPSFHATHRLVLSADDDGGAVAKLVGRGAVDSASGDYVETAEEVSLAPEVLLVPGGKGVRREQSNDFLKRWLAVASGAAQVVFSVCTGSWLLGAAGVLDGRRATSNKTALAAGLPQQAAPDVNWVLKARWVEEKDVESNRLYLTSSGVSAGGDAALALIAYVSGAEHAENIARDAEWTWHRQADEDPFATAL